MYSKSPISGVASAGISRQYCDQLCGQSSTCNIHSRRPVTDEDIHDGRGGHLVTCQDDQPEMVTAVAGHDVEIVPGDITEVAVIDDVVSDDSECDVSSLLSAVTYWCQGKNYCFEILEICFLTQCCACVRKARRMCSRQWCPDICHDFSLSRHFTCQDSLARGEGLQLHRDSMSNIYQGTIFQEIQ